MKVTQLCLFVSPLDYTVHGILQTRILKWVAFPFSSGSSQRRDQTQDSHIAGRFFTSSPAPKFKSISSLALSFLHSPTLTSIHDYWKNHSLARKTFVGRVMSLLFNMLSRLVIAFLPRNKCLLISWLQSPSTVILEPSQKNNVSHCFPIYLP